MEVAEGDGGFEERRIGETRSDATQRSKEETFNSERRLASVDSHGFLLLLTCQWTHSR